MLEVAREPSVVATAAAPPPPPPPPPLASRPRSPCLVLPVPQLGAGAAAMFKWVLGVFSRLDADSQLRVGDFAFEDPTSLAKVRGWMGCAPDWVEGCLPTTAIVRQPACAGRTASQRDSADDRSSACLCSIAGCRWSPLLGGAPPPPPPSHRCRAPASLASPPSSCPSSSPPITRRSACPPRCRRRSGAVCRGVCVCVC